MTEEQQAALDLAILNLKTHGDDQLLTAIKPLLEFYESAERPVCVDCGDSIMAHNPGTCGTCHATKYENASADNRLAADQQVVAWAYEYATLRHDDGTYGGWCKDVKPVKPIMPEGAVRNVQALVRQAKEGT